MKGKGKKGQEGLYLISGMYAHRSEQTQTKEMLWTTVVNMIEDSRLLLRTLLDGLVTISVIVIRILVELEFRV